MRLILTVLACTQLGGCFFVFIPGALMSKAADAVTGAKGAHCVPAAAKVGDAIVLDGGQLMTVQSLSGPSSRCVNPAHPIRAELG